MRLNNALAGSPHLIQMIGWDTSATIDDEASCIRVEIYCPERASTICSAAARCALA
jgi:hypothetical protein